jgi:hypothetical protein
MRFFAPMVLVGLALSPTDSAEPLPKPDSTEPVPADWPPCAFVGKVVALSDETITIKPQGHLKIYRIPSSADRPAKKEQVYVQDNTKPARLFVFSDPLLYFNGTLPAARRRGLGLSPTTGHKISDVQTGDLVFISCNRAKGVDYCTRLEIQRRPGGRVPPAIDDDKRDPNKRIDTGYNVAQFVEETVAPMWAPWLLVRFNR